MKLTNEQKEQITKKLLNFGFYDFQIPALLQGKKLNTNFGHAQIKSPEQLNVYTGYDDTNTIYNL